MFGATRFSGTGQYFERTTNVPESVTFTMMCWASVTTHAGLNHTVLALAGDASNYYWLQSRSGAVWGLFNGTTLTTGSAMLETLWYHLAMVVDGTGTGNFRLYVNGIQDISMAAKSLTATEIKIAASTNEGNLLNGRIAGVKIWEDALTPDEITKEYRQIAPVRLHNLNSFYPCGAYGARDFSGRGYRLAITGSPTIEGGPPVPWIAQPTSRRVKAAAAGGAGAAKPRMMRLALLGVH